jgi:hypothetical protein
VVQKLGRDHRADGVTADILRAGAAAAITKKPGHRVGAARLQVATEDVALCHGPIIARQWAPMPRPAPFHPP